jgi:hypothetical protein
VGTQNYGPAPASCRDGINSRCSVNPRGVVVVGPEGLPSAGWAEDGLSEWPRPSGVVDRERLTSVGPSPTTMLYPARVEVPPGFDSFAVLGR